MSTTNSSFIVYACPTGELNTQIEKYLIESSKYGKNAAHKYMPHCTLTGFFTDEISSIPVYIRALEQAYTKARSDNLSLDIEITRLTFRENWHGLELQASGLKQLVANFANLEQSTTRSENLRLKDWLHLSLAYDFNPQLGEDLKHLATETIDLQKDVNWQLRFYQKDPDWSWKCLHTWDI